MNELNPNPEDMKLGCLLRETRATPPLAPRFQQDVWRRIEDTGEPDAGAPAWLERLAGWALRPKLAFATVVVLVLAGSVLGARHGAHSARQDAQARYVASVVPELLR